MATSFPSTVNEILDTHHLRHQLAGTCHAYHWTCNCQTNTLWQVYDGSYLPLSTSTVSPEVVVLEHLKLKSCAWLVVFSKFVVNRACKEYPFVSNSIWHLRLGINGIRDQKHLTQCSFTSISMNGLNLKLNSLVRVYTIYKDKKPIVFM